MSNLQNSHSRFVGCSVAENHNLIFLIVVVVVVVVVVFCFLLLLFFFNLFIFYVATQ